MKVGDLVKSDEWVNDGKPGIIVKLDHPAAYCRTARVLTDEGIYLIRTGNLQVINKSEKRCGKR